MSGAWPKPGQMAYETECGPFPDIGIEAESSADGAARVCGNWSGSDPVHIAGMTRKMNNGEATSDDGWQYECIGGSSGRLIEACEVFCMEAKQ